MSLEDPTKPIK